MLFLVLSILFNASASLLLKLSIDSSAVARLLMIGGGVGFYGLAFVSYYACLRTFPLSVAYPVITGGAILTIVIVAGPVLGESLTVSKALGAALVICGGMLLLRQA